MYEKKIICSKCGKEQTTMEFCKDMYKLLHTKSENQLHEQCKILDEFRKTGGKLLDQFGDKHRCLDCMLKIYRENNLLVI